MSILVKPWKIANRKKQFITFKVPNGDCGLNGAGQAV